MVVVVECPECETRYRIDVARLSAAGSLLKCTRCGRMFPPPSTSTSVSPPSRRTAKRSKSAANESLTLPFGDAAAKPPVLPDDEKVLEPDEAFTLGNAAGEPEAFDQEPEPEPPPPEESVAPEDLRFSFEDEEPPGEELPPAKPEPPPVELRRPTPTAATPPTRTRTRAKAAPKPPPEPDLSFADEDEPEAPAARGNDTGKFWFLGLFLVTMVVGYFLLWRALAADATLTDRWLGSIPIVGPLTTERLLARDVTVVGANGAYDKIGHGRGTEAFVISGEASSLANMPLHSVRVRGRLFDNDGKMVADKSIYCGNAVSTAILNDLSARELSVLQQIQPPARFAIEPGVAKAFVIVFDDPPPGIASFTVEVVGARRQLGRVDLPG